MSRFLVDTDVLSETVRSTPDERVTAFVAAQDPVLVSAVTVFEVARGVARVPASRRRRVLDAWLARLLEGGVEILALDRAAALEAAKLDDKARRAGRPIETRDLFILATAAAAGAGVATRNVTHFRGRGVPVFDPFRGLTH